MRMFIFKFFKSVDESSKTPAFQFPQFFNLNKLNKSHRPVTFCRIVLSWNHNKRACLQSSASVTPTVSILRLLVLFIPIPSLWIFIDHPVQTN